MPEKDMKDFLFDLWDQLDDLPLDESYVVYDDEQEFSGDYRDPFAGFEPREIRAIFWLALEMKMHDKFEDLVSILRRIRNGESLYRNIYLSKNDGSKRKIDAPGKELKKIQRKLNKCFLSELPVNKNAFGFSRGGIINAIEPHLSSKVILCVDFQDAFPAVSRENLMDALIRGRVVSQCGSAHLKSSYSVKPGIFSWYAANTIADLTTLENKLPQGAPTSPRLFDLVCWEIDERLSKLAERVNGVYTRYADNVFLSLKVKDRIDKSLSRAVLHVIEGRRGAMPEFIWHKFRIVKLGTDAHRMLGMNVADGQIRNTRSFKRRLRLMVYHVFWLLEKEMDFESEWEQLRGMMQFAQIKTLPPKLVEDYKKLEERII